jgi:hypothetical protein
MNQLFTAAISMIVAQVIGGTLADHMETLSAHTAVFCQFSGQFDDDKVKIAMDSAFSKIDRYIESHHLHRETGTYPTMYVKVFSEETASMSGEVAIDVEPTSDTGSLVDGIQIGKTPSGKAVKFETSAPYGEPNEFYEDVAAWLVSHRLKPKSEAWEVYVKQGSTVARQDRLTYIYYLIAP